MTGTLKVSAAAPDTMETPVARCPSRALQTIRQRASG